jgi:hypothetical protein
MKKEDLLFVIMFFSGIFVALYMIFYLSGFSYDPMDSIYNLSLKKCEFPKKTKNFTLEFIKTDDMRTSRADFARKYKLKYNTTAQYSSDNFWGTIDIYTFASKKNVDEAWAEQTKERDTDRTKECEFNGIKGYCFNMAVDDPMTVFSWKEGDTYRNIMFDITKGNKKSVEENRRMIKDIIKSFVPMSSGCKADIDEDYAVPYLKKMSI